MMTNQLDTIVKGHSIARLILKYGGWLDENDNEIIRFPTPHAKDQFLKAVDSAREKDRVRHSVT